MVKTNNLSGLNHVLSVRRFALHIQHYFQFKAPCSYSGGSKKEQCKLGKYESYLFLLAPRKTVTRDVEKKTKWHKPMMRDIKLCNINKKSTKYMQI